MPVKHGALVSWTCACSGMSLYFKKSRRGVLTIFAICIQCFWAFETFLGRAVSGRELVVLWQPSLMYCALQGVSFALGLQAGIYNLFLRLWCHNRQFARVVKGVDLRSTAGNCAWVRTP